jgi:hypothetical protein
MRPFKGLELLILTLLTFSAGGLEAQASQDDRVLPQVVPWGARPLPRELAVEPKLLSWTVNSDSTPRRPFFLPRPGEHTAYWVGFGAGLALSPLLWCEGSGCGAVDKASTSLLLAVGGAVSGLLLSRTF